GRDRGDRAGDPITGAAMGGAAHRRPHAQVRRDHALVRSAIMKRVVCPGSFDPVANGHLDIIGRSAALFDEVIVAVLINEAKTGLFTVDERMDLLRQTTASYPNVRVESFRGLLVEFCRARGAGIVVKGIRAVSDFDYE